MLKQRAGGRGGGLLPPQFGETFIGQNLLLAIVFCGREPLASQTAASGFTTVKGHCAWLIDADALSLSL